MRDLVPPTSTEHAFKTSDVKSCHQVFYVSSVWGPGLTAV